ncbi:putative Zn-dependent protease-like protein [Mycobacteroides abscessus subsp. abscessus]|nr:putative Zn-dependent protease-like protein [Mycobacteroides abscessus subsp. abscessus]
MEINAKRGVGSAWAGVCTPEFVDVPTEALLRQLSERLTAAQNQIELTAGRYETLLPPSATGDLMQYLVWTMGGRGAHEGRNAFAGPGGTRIGERLTELPVTVYSDPSYPGLESSPFVATPISRESLSVFDNGVGIERVDWVRDGVINALSYSRADAAEFGAAPTVGADNLVMTGGGSQTLEQMIAATENGLLLTTLWYIREVDPTTLLLTGLTRDGVYLVRDGQITGAVNNYRFNESPIDLLRRVSQVGATEYTLPREWSDYATRQAMPALLYGYARHERQTTFLASSTGLRRRFTQPTGQVEINAKRGVGSAWAGVCTPEFVDVPTEALLRQLSERLTAAQNQIELTAGRYETLLPPSATGDLMQYLVWTMGGRGAHEGRSAFAGPGGTRIGERLTDLPVTVYSDPSYPGLESSPFVATPISRESLSVFDNGVGIERVDWVRDGAINALSYSRADAAEFGAAPTVGADNLVMTGGGSQTLEQMIAATENGLLLTTLWYIREVDPTTLLLTGLTRDGVYLVRDGQITGAVNNYRFNESPIDLLRRVSQVGATEYTLPREWSDYATRQAMPALRIPDFHMSSVSAAQ